MRRVVDVATRDGVAITVPVVVISEWWRGASPLRSVIRRMVAIEPMDEELAALAGEALAVVGGATTIDAIVVASAARRGDIVYTSDFDDLSRFASVFPTVRCIGV